ncbi:MAG: peptidylprolyl isomerase [bacterium]|nr:peptidylprolyl isomerase [bacterium]
MKKCILFLFLCGIAITASIAYTAQDRIIARVNEDIITLSELEERLRPVVSKYENSFEGEELLQRLAKAEEYWLNQLIENKLILQEATRKGIEAPEEEVKERLDKITADFDSELQFKLFLQSQGLHLQQLKQTIEENIKINKATAHIRQKAQYKISPTDTLNYYNEHLDEFREEPQIRASHILIRFKDNESESLKLIQSIEKEIKNGGDFAALAQQHSDGPHAKEGGDLGFFSRGQHMPEIDEAAFSLNVGELSSIIKSRLGYHLIVVKQKKKERVKPFAEVQDSIENTILRNEAKQLWDKWIVSLKEKSFIVTYDLH